MKKLLLIPMIAAAMVLPLAAEEVKVQSEPVQTEQTSAPEQKLIDQVLTDYREGRYNSFLKKMDSTYQEANKKWEYNNLLEERKKLSTVVQDYGVEKPDPFKKEIVTLHEARDRELIDVCLAHPDEKISREVRDMVFFTPNKLEADSIAFIHGLSQKFKGDGTTPLENKLIRIDTEFWLKSLSLDIAHSQNKVDSETYQKQHLVLQMEKIKQMQKATEGDLVNVKLKSYVDTAAEVLPKVHASATTRKYLTALGNHKVTPKNATEEKLQVIMAKYLEKEEALTAKHFPAG